MPTRKNAIRPAFRLRRRVIFEVFAGGTHVATQNSDGASSPFDGDVVFHTADPVTGTKGFFPGNGAGTYTEEFEPLGQQIETTNPGTGYPTSYPEVLGNGKDPEWQCLRWEQFRAGAFRDMPIHCQKKVALDPKFFGLYYGDIEEETSPENISKRSGSPPTLKYPTKADPLKERREGRVSAAVATAKGDTEGPIRGEQGVGCDPNDPNKRMMIANVIDFSETGKSICGVRGQCFT